MIERVAPKKKQKKQNAVARGLLGVVSGGANMLLPGTGGLVNVLGSKILNALGLSEKVVLPPEYGQGGTSMGEGGSIVASADAPVQFGRMQEQTSFTRMLHRAGNGDVIMHIREPLFDVATAGTVNTNNPAMTALYPFNASFALIKNVAAQFCWYRILACKLHYTHWAPTSTKARVCLAHTPTDTYNNSVAPVANELAKLEHFACGSAYEDFGLEFEPTAPLNWFPCFPSMASAPSFDKSQGSLVVATDLNSTTSDTIGTAYIEFVVAFREQRSPTVTVGVTLGLLGMYKRADVYRILGRIYDEYSEAEADAIVAGIDPIHFNDAIKLQPREDVEYEPSFAKVLDLVQRFDGLSTKGKQKLPNLAYTSVISSSSIRQ